MLLGGSLAMAESEVKEGSASAQAKAYFGTMKEKKFDELSAYFAPSALKNFREMMGFLNELPVEEAAEPLTMFFGEGATAESVQEMSDAEFFGGFMNFVMGRAEMAGGLNFEKIEVLGEVAEGEDLMHVVTRNKISVGEIEVESMEVMSFKKEDGKWRAVLQGEMKGLAEQLRSAFAQ